MQSRFSISALTYSKCWRLIHILGIVALIGAALISMCSFSEPIDIHNNILHEIEEKEKEHPSWIQIEDEDGNTTWVQIS